MLLYGPPGTGKTMLAKATAGEIDATFFRISAADVLSKWVGEAEQNIKKLFDAAASETRSIIFIDEIEALVPARRDEGSSVMQRVVPQILQGMEGFEKRGDVPVLFMGATNVPWQLDPAVLRPGRFDEKVYVPLPDLAARRRLLELYLAHRPLGRGRESRCTERAARRLQRGRHQVPLRSRGGRPVHAKRRRRRRRRDHATRFWMMRCTMSCHRLPRKRSQSLTNGREHGHAPEHVIPRN